MSFQWYKTTESDVPWYLTFGGVYHDTKDIHDGKPYYYLSFIMKNYLQVLKVDRNELRVAWNYEYFVDTLEDDAIEYKNYKVPGLLKQDT